MRLAVIEDNTVVNVIESDADALNNDPSIGDIVVELISPAWIGWTYANGTFSKPAQPEDTE